MRSREPQALDSATRVRLLRAVAALHELREVELVGTQIEAVALALHEGVGLTSREVERVCSCAARWVALPARLRALYASSLAGDTSTRTAASSGLSRILGASARPVAGTTYAVLRREWVRVHGYSPPLELVPFPKEDTP